MTGIDTYAAHQHWKDERKYLEAIGFVGVNEDSVVSILGDEEGNYETLLTPRAARWVTKKLIALAKGL